MYSHYQIAVVHTEYVVVCYLGFAEKQIAEVI